MTGFKPAVRAGVGLLIGIAGPTGSGKTLSALRLARGLAGYDDSKIAFIDTEAGRALHYAPRKGEAPNGFTFGFAHAELSAPFTPEAYLDKIEEAESAGFGVIVIDSFSHVWAGDGGLQDMHDDELERAVERARKRAEENNWRFDIDRERDKGSVGAWRGPKTRHKRMVSRLLQCRAHLVICMRAEDKLRMETKEEQGRGGKTFTRTEITPADKLPPAERWAPICEKRFPYELITSLVLTPDRPGVPIPLKLQEQHRPFVSLTCPLDEKTGAGLAAWAIGAPQSHKPNAATTPSAPSHLGGAGEDSASSPYLVRHGAHSYDAAEPGAVATQVPPLDMGSDDWRDWCAALKDLILNAPAAARRHWLDHNADNLLALQAKHPAWVARLEALAPSAPPHPGAGDGAADGSGQTGAAAPSNISAQGGA